MVVKCGEAFFMMQQDKPIVIIGQGEVNKAAFMQLAGKSRIIALDGAAEFVMAQGFVPDAVIGDMDSFDMADLPQASDLIQIDEQHSNDFEKALYHFKPTMVYGIGLFGKRFDQAMANLHVMAKFHGKSQIIAITNDEIITVHKGPIQLMAEPQGLVAIVPLMPIDFASSAGLGYGIDDMTLGFGEMISSSNHATAPQIEIVPHAHDKAAAYAICRPLSLLSALIAQYIA